MAEWDKKGEEEISEIESNVSTTTWGPRRAHDMVNAQKSIRIALSLSLLLLLFLWRRKMEGAL